MDNFIKLITEVWNTGFLGIDLGSIISSLAVILLAFLFRGFIISIILNALGRLADSTESKIDDEILNALRRPIGLIPITIALYICTLILPLDGLMGVIPTIRSLIQISEPTRPRLIWYAVFCLKKKKIFRALT